MSDDAPRYAILDRDRNLIHTTKTKSEAESAKEYLSAETPWGRPYIIEPASLAEELELVIRRWYAQADKMRQEGYGASYQSTRGCADELALVLEEWGVDLDDRGIDYDQLRRGAGRDMLKQNDGR